MKVSLKKAAMVLMIAISGLSFSDDDRTGFLSNMRELKDSTGCTRKYKSN